MAQRRRGRPAGARAGRRNASTPSVWPTRARRCLPGIGPRGRRRSAAIVWQDRRSMSVCAALAATGAGERLAAITGLELDPYFSAPKIAWFRAQVGGGPTITTSDTWLLHRLCGAFVTDVATASRSLLLDLDNAPMAPRSLRMRSGSTSDALPEVVANAGVIGTTTAFGGDDADRRDVRRPAGRPVRRIVLRGGGGEVHLRHRGVPPRLDRTLPDPFDQRARRMHRLAARRGDDLVPRRAGVHRRLGGGLVAADRDHRRTRRPRPPRRRRRLSDDGRRSFPVWPGWRHPSGGPTPMARSPDSTWRPPGRSWSGP